MTERPYKAALPFDRAADVLREEAARGWRCADLVKTFLALVERDGIASGLADAACDRPRTSSERIVELGVPVEM